MKSKELFLATTALEDFWDKKAKILFLGEWCLRYDQKKIWKDLDYSVCDYPWDDRKKMADAALYCEAVYEDLLLYLASCLNDVHNTNHGIRYWKIVLGPGLIRYIHALYDRYVCMRSAVEMYGSLRTIGLARTSFITPIDFNHFQSLYIDDFYNLQLFTQIFEHLEMLIEKYQDMDGEVGNHCMSWKGSSYYKSAKKFFLHVSGLAFKCFGHTVPIWLVSGYLQRRNGIELGVRTQGRALLFNLRFLDKKIRAIVSNLKQKAILRTTFMKKELSNFATDDFRYFLINSLKQNFPLVYLEGYSEIINLLNPYLKKPPRVMATATGYESSTAYDFLAAEMAERGTKLIVLQHGGNFGTTSLHPLEYYDQSVSDGYWTWGWRHGIASKCKPMPSQVLEGIKRTHRETGIVRSRMPKVLYCGNNGARYLVFFWSNPVGPQWKQVIEWQHRWIENLSQEVFHNLVVRLYPNDAYHWCQKERLIDVFPSIKFDNLRRPFKELLNDYDIIVIDSNHTAMLEALLANKPTILFWASQLNELRSSALPFYEELRQVGILHDTPEAAAKKVNDIYHQPYDWWMRRDTQKARQKFCENFAYVLTQWVKIWAQELLKLCALKNEYANATKSRQNKDLRT